MSGYDCRNKPRNVATDKPPSAQDGDKFRSIFSDSLQPIAIPGKKARGTLLANQHCGNGCSIKRAPLSVSYYNEISGGRIGRGVVRRRCPAGPVLNLWFHPANCVYHPMKEHEFEDTRSHQKKPKQISGTRSLGRLLRPTRRRTRLATSFV